MYVAKDSQGRFIGLEDCQTKDIGRAKKFDHPEECPEWSTVFAVKTRKRRWHPLRLGDYWLSDSFNPKVAFKLHFKDCGARFYSVPVKAPEGAYLELPEGVWVMGDEEMYLEETVAVKRRLMLGKLYVTDYDTGELGSADISLSPLLGHAMLVEKLTEAQKTIGLRLE